MPDLATASREGTIQQLKNQIGGVSGGAIMNPNVQAWALLDIAQSLITIQQQLAKIAAGRG